MLAEDPAAKQLAAESAAHAERAAKQREAALVATAQALGKPPEKVRALIEQSGLDPSKLPGDDAKRRAAFEQLARDVREAAGDDAAKAEEQVAPLLDRASPLSPCGSGDV